MAFEASYGTISYMKKAYELMLVINPGLEITDKSAGELVQKLIGTMGTVAGVSLLGKKQLAYPIQKFTEGQYVLAKLESERMSVREIEKKIQLGNDVLRFLLIVN